MRQRYISLILVMVIFMTAFPLQSQAVVYDQEAYDHWFEELSPELSNAIALDKGVPASITVAGNVYYINKWFINLPDNPKLVYGEPDDWKDGHGYRYLGYNANSQPFTNQEYVPDAIDGDFDPLTRDWIREPIPLW